MSNEDISCKHQTYKKIIPCGTEGTIVLCGECNQQLDEWKGGLFEN